MTKDSLKRKIKEEGLAGSVLYYLGRFCSKAELAMVGKWFGNHGKLRQNCIVLKNPYHAGHDRQSQGLL